MPHARAIADTPSLRTELRLAVLAHWVRAGLDLMRGATKTGRGLVGGAIALWRVAQAIRLALQLARRLAELGCATRLGEPAPAAASGPAPSDPGPSLNALALSRALAQLCAAIRAAPGVAPHRPLKSMPVAAAVLRLGLPRRPGRRPSFRGPRPHRPPGSNPPCGRRRCPHTAHPSSPPIASPTTGRPALARA